LSSAIIYNVTTKVDQSIASEWLQWLKEEHINDMIGTGCFTHAVILQMTEVDETEGPTYAVQYHAESKALYNHYINEYSSEMREKSHKRWGDKIISFRSVLKIID
jgi:hypothetical protein